MGGGALRFWALRLVRYWSLGHWSGIGVKEGQCDTTALAGARAPRVCAIFRWF